MAKQPKHGVLVKLPLTCGTCQTVTEFLLLRWCGACGDAICPGCFVKEEEQTYPHRCRRCLAENRPTKLELAGRRMAQEQEERFLKAIST